MADIKIINNISETGLSIVRKAGYNLSRDTENPVGIYMRSTPIHDYKFNPELLAIARSGVGVNNIPIERCTKEGIAVFNTPGGNSDGVKELVIAAMIIIARDILGSMKWVHALTGTDAEMSEKMENGKVKFVGPEIGGKTLGVVGLGNVGSKVANAALDLGMTVYGYDPYLSVDAAWKVSKNVIRVESLEAMLPLCDYVTLHPTLTDETRGMINERTIGFMKDGARLINYSRREVVDEDAVVAALDSGKIVRFATDFVSSKLIDREDVSITPHLGGSTDESEVNCAVMAAQELVEYLKTGNVRNSVNLPTVVLDRMGVARLCVIHRNVPRMINRFLDLIGADNINVEHMINKPMGGTAYTIIDTGSRISNDIVEKINAMEEVMRVRVIE